MSKIKMRCITCGKWFQSANAKEVTCPDCAQKARKEKLAAKNTPPITDKPAAAIGQAGRPLVPPKPKSTQGGTNQWLDKLDDVKVAQPDVPAPRPKFSSAPAQRDTRTGPAGPRPPGGSGQYREDRGNSQTYGPSAYRTSGDARLSPTLGQRPRQPMEGAVTRGPGAGPAKPWQKEASRSGGGARPKGRPKATRPPVPPKLKREKIPPPPPFVPTDEQVQQVEERYIELATPSEFDGIRTQIAHELNIPKKGVKKIIKDLRARQNIPSWWEIQVYKGSSEELENIKTIYEPYLPVPPVGVHKILAEVLKLKPGTIYQAIKTIRQEMKLPQYNDPELHKAELSQASQSIASEEQASSVTTSEGAAETISHSEEQAGSVTTSEGAVEAVSHLEEQAGSVTTSEGAAETVSHAEEQAENTGSSAATAE